MLFVILLEFNVEMEMLNLTCLSSLKSESLKNMTVREFEFETGSVCANCAPRHDPTALPRPPSPSQENNNHVLVIVF